MRVPVAALLAYGATTQLSVGEQFLATTAGGLIALAAHGGKTATRVAVTPSPEPFSNIALSLGEDALAVFLMWLATQHPWPSLLFILPLLLVYEGGVIFLDGPRGEQIRNGADAFLRWLLEASGLQQFFWAPVLLVIGLPYRKRFGGDFTLGTVVPYVLQNTPCEVILLREAVATSEERRSRGVEPAQIAPPSAAVVSRR